MKSFNELKLREAIANEYTISGFRQGPDCGDCFAERVFKRYEGEDMDADAIKSLES